MKLPPHLIIFGQKWKVTEDELPDSTAGLCYKAEKSIYINSRLSKKEVISTLLHEMGHAMFNRCGIDQSVSAELEEVIQENWATMITECFNLSFKKKP